MTPALWIGAVVVAVGAAAAFAIPAVQRRGATAGEAEAKGASPRRRRLRGDPTEPS